MASTHDQQCFAFNAGRTGPGFRFLCMCKPATKDDVNHPSHYTSHPSGVECIAIVEHMNFNLGNAIKYTWRAGLKSPDAIKDLEKARWYIAREIQRLNGKDDKPKEHGASTEPAEDRASEVERVLTSGRFAGGRGQAP